MTSPINRLLGLLIPSLILIVAGVSILHSIMPSLAPYQLLYALVGLLLAFLISRIDLELLSSSEWFWYGVGVVSLAATELFGAMSRGSTRWIDLFGFRFQTSEFAKICIILFVAIWLSKHRLTKLKDLFRFSLISFFPIVLVFLQPDLGTAILFFTIVATGAIAAGLPFKQIAIVGLMGILIFPFAIRTLKPYQVARITSFSNQTDDRLGSGYNANQATIAVGSGQIMGRGLGQGTQSHLKFLPERQTDFIFASFVEELGLVGGLIIISAYMWLIANLCLTARVATSTAQSLVSLVSAGLLLVQVSVNIGMNMSIVPITGITLPLVSYGGSSLISTCIIIGLNWSVITHTRKNVSNLEIR